jgi:hypothetical protein
MANIADDNVASVGTGQQGSGGHGADWEKKSHATPQTPEDRINEIADDAAAKGKDRQRREDPTIFTK